MDFSGTMGEDSHRNSQLARCVAGVEKDEFPVGNELGSGLHLKSLLMSAWAELPPRKPPGVWAWRQQNTAGLPVAQQLPLGPILTEARACVQGRHLWGPRGGGSQGTGSGSTVRAWQDGKSWKERR